MNIICEQQTVKKWLKPLTAKQALVVTGVWQKWRFSASQTHLWLIKHRFSASTFVVKIGTFAKPQNVSVIFTRPDNITLQNLYKKSYVLLPTHLVPTTICTTTPGAFMAPNF